MIGFTKTWSRELGPKGVRVNAVAPGFIATPILSTIPGKVIEEMEHRVPLRRLGQPDEVAHAIAFFCTEAAGFITGEALGGGTFTWTAAMVIEFLGMDDAPSENPE